jgi:acetolactate decarboxylase
MSRPIIDVRNSLLFLLSLFSGISLSFSQNVPVFHTGEMKQLHQKGFAAATVNLDTLQKDHLYALGPVAHLQGEVFAWDGKVFVASLSKEQKRPFVSKNPEAVSTIFLVYTYVSKWDTIKLHLKTTNLNELVREIEFNAHVHGLDTSKPFPFLMLGAFSKAKGHIVFADTPTSQIKPGTLERYKHYYDFNSQKVQLLGFYSSHHQGVFTHHGSKLHIHYRMFNKYEAGHLDEISFDGSKTVLLLLPSAIQ